MSCVSPANQSSHAPTPAAIRLKTALFHHLFSRGVTTVQSITPVLIHQPMNTPNPPRACPTASGSKPILNQIKVAWAKLRINGQNKILGHPVSTRPQPYFVRNCLFPLAGAVAGLPKDEGNALAPSRTPIPRGYAVSGNEHRTNAGSRHSSSVGHTTRHCSATSRDQSVSVPVPRRPLVAVLAIPMY